MAAPRRSGDVEIRERVTVGRDDDAGAAAVAVGREDGDRRPRDPLDGFDAGLFGGEDVGGGLCRASRERKLKNANCKLQNANCR